MVPRLDLNEIQGDLLSGMQKNAELFLFFKIADAARFKDLAREYVVSRLTNGRMVPERDGSVEARRHRGGSGQMPWLGVNLGFTRDGLMRLLGPNRPRMDPAFERGADDPETIAALNDPPPSKWLRSFLSDRINGVFLIVGPDKFFVTSHGNTLRGRLGSAMKTVYSEIGTVRPGRERGHEHFGFSDGISQPGIRGLTPLSRPSAAPEQGLPGQDLIWAGEFVLGYPGQDPRDPIKPGPIAPLSSACPN
jgi:deferrochelatase/peroxidase EfeB